MNPWLVKVGIALVGTLAGFLLGRWKRRQQAQDDKKKPRFDADDFRERHKEAVVCFAGTGGLVGIISTISALSGDSEVQLFWLLLLFVFIPCFSLAMSIIVGLFSIPSLSSRENRRNPVLSRLLGLALKLPGVKEIRESIEELPNGLKKDWLVFQAQVFYVPFFVSCVATYLLVLAFSCITIVWSSTFFDQRAFLPILEWIALPWSLYDGAQPSEELLRYTQSPPSECRPIERWHWWSYILAAQLCYGLGPRVVFLAYAERRFRKGFKDWRKARSRSEAA